jgi:hypothetical protein
MFHIFYVLSKQIVLLVTLWPQSFSLPTIVRCVAVIMVPADRELYDDFVHSQTPT